MRRYKSNATGMMKKPNCTLINLWVIIIILAGTEINKVRKSKNSRYKSKQT